MNSVTIIPYEPRYQPDFKRLNVAWISHYFTVETHDLEQLDHPDIHVLPNGGQIFLARRGFARLNDEIVGCSAMVNTTTAGHNPASFELAKMAVSPEAQGQGIGKQLALVCIDYARQMGAKTVWLESNRVLAPALAMYASVGFREVPGIPTPYARADIRMEMTL